MKYALSARNQLPGKVLSVEEGAVNSIVKMEVLGGDQGNLCDGRRIELS